MSFDWLIRGGTVLDGTGAPGRRADVGLTGDRVSALAPALGGEAAQVVDAEGCIVAPGFIDMHAHSDFALLAHPSAEAKVRQGVTTEVTGMCGFSPAPSATGRGVAPGVGRVPVPSARLGVDQLRLATYQAPHRYPAGIPWVWVNGHAVLEGGRFHPRPTGRVRAPPH